MAVWVLAVDLGKTSSRVALVTDGRVIRDARADGTPGLAHPGGLAAALAVTVRLARELVNDTDRPRLIGIGAAGTRVGAAAAAQLAEAVRAALSAERAMVTNDVVTAHVGALGGGPGVVVIAGTGAVALAVGPDCSSAIVDGAGWWLGDEGGGAWVGAEGLRAVLRAADGRGPKTTMLTSAAARRFGSLDAVRALAGQVNPAAVAASFGPDVAETARAGDPVAVEILNRAASALATTTLAAVRTLAPTTDGAAGTPVPVALVGGLAEWGDVLLNRWRAAVGDCTTLVEPPPRAALLGAAELAA